MSLDLYLAYLIACLFIALVPGPTITLIIATSIRHGTRAGLANVAGTQVGLAIMIAVVGIGLASLIEGMGHWFEWLRLIGAAYLIWMGIQMFRSSGQADAAGVPAAPRGGFFLQGVLVAASNPKTMIFFGAFFPQFIDPAGNYTLQIVVMGLTAMAIAAVTDSCICDARRPRRPLPVSPPPQACLAYQRQLPGRRRAVAGVFPGEVKLLFPPPRPELVEGTGRRAIPHSLPSRSDQQSEEAVMVDVAHDGGVLRPLGDAPPVDHRHAHGQLGCGLDGDVAVPALEQLGLQQIGDDARVVQRPAVGTVLLLVEAFEEFEHFRARNADPGAELAEGGDALGCRQRLVGDVERHGDDRHA